MLYLLQTDTAQNIAATAVATAEKVSLWTLLDKGGWIMYPLYLLLILAIYVFTERLLAIRRAGLIDPQFMVIVRDHILSGNVQAAKTYARSHL